MTSPQPGWYADPAGAADLRWWDGERWTGAVLTGGVQRTVPLPHRPPAAGGGTGLRGLLPRAGLALRSGPDGTCALRDLAGETVARVEPVGRSVLDQVARALPALRDLVPLRFEVRSADGASLLLLTRSRARTVVEAAGAAVEGEVVLASPSRRLVRRAGEVVAALELGGGRGEVRDPAGRLLATLAARSGEDELVLRPAAPLPDPLAALVVAAGVAVVLDGPPASG